MKRYILRVSCLLWCLKTCNNYAIGIGSNFCIKNRHTNSSNKTMLVQQGEKKGGDRRVVPIPLINFTMRTVRYVPLCFLKAQKFLIHRRFVYPYVCQADAAGFAMTHFVVWATTSHLDLSSALCRL